MVRVIVVCAVLIVSGTSILGQDCNELGFLKDELSNDGLHPNPQGYAVMAPLAEAAITTSFKSRR